MSSVAETDALSPERHTSRLTDDHDDGLEFVYLDCPTSAALHVGSGPSGPTPTPSVGTRRGREPGSNHNSRSSSRIRRSAASSPRTPPDAHGASLGVPCRPGRSGGNGRERARAVAAMLRPAPVTSTEHRATESFGMSESGRLGTCPTSWPSPGSRRLLLHYGSGGVCQLRSSSAGSISVVRVGTIGVAGCSRRAPTCDRGMSLNHR